MKRLVAGLVVVALGCSGASAGAAPGPGGVYRVGVESNFGFSDDLDPTGESGQLGMDIESNLLVRSLVGYDHVAGRAGLKLVPDLATDVPAPTDDGKTYTFHLKAGVKFGPPLNRAVTSPDVAYAMERLAKPRDGGQLGFYYTPIAGWNAYASGKAKTIAGITTPNRSTIVFRLTRPTGDFPARMAMPMTGPIPREIAGCFEGKPGEYGRDIVSTGPYMIAGADKLDASSCSRLKPMSGFDGQTSLTLVRNPLYDSSTDSKAARENFPDEFHFTVDSSVTDIVQKVEAGQLDDEIAGVLPPQDLERYDRDPKLRRFLKLYPALGTYWITMNVTQPPFDDVHVRRALNWVLDKAGILQLVGGPAVGSVATHIVPDPLIDDRLAGYDPYRTPGSHGSAVKARAAMKGSIYDTSGSGMCSAAACKNVLLLTATNSIDPALAALIQQDAAKIGITFAVRSVNGPFPVLMTVSKEIPIADFTGLFTNLPDPIGMLEPTFDGRSIIPVGNPNFPLLGITPAQCRKLHVTGDCSPYNARTGLGVPNVDGLLDRCSALAGPLSSQCWSRVEKLLMTQDVPVIPMFWPSIPHIIGRNVSKWVYDEFGDLTAFAHVAVS